MRACAQLALWRCVSLVEIVPGTWVCGRAPSQYPPPHPPPPPPPPPPALPADVIAQEAEKFVLQAANDSRPFFAYIAPYAPHPPYLPALRHRGALAGALEV